MYRRYTPSPQTNGQGSLVNSATSQKKPQAMPRGAFKDSPPQKNQSAHLASTTFPAPQKNPQGQHPLPHNPKSQSPTSQNTPPVKNSSSANKSGHAGASPQSKRGNNPSSHSGTNFPNQAKNHANSHASKPTKSYPNTPGHRRRFYAPSPLRSSRRKPAKPCNSQKKNFTSFFQNMLPTTIYNPQSKKILGFLGAEDLLLVALIFLFMESDEEDNTLTIIALAYILLSEYIDIPDLLF